MEVEDQEEVVIMAVKELKMSPAKSVRSSEWSLKNGLLYYRGKVYIPRTKLRRQILTLCHNSKLTGHPRRWKMLELVSRNYWRYMVIVDSVTKRSHFVSTVTTLSTTGTAQLYLCKGTLLPTHLSNRISPPHNSEYILSMQCLVCPTTSPVNCLLLNPTPSASPPC